MEISRGKKTKQRSEDPVGDRVLLLGIPGIKKNKAAYQLAAELGRLGHRYEVLSFEDDFLFVSNRVRERQTFLGASLAKQHELWSQAWEACRDKLKRGGHYIISMHGCFVGKLFDARCVFNPGMIADVIRPTIIITLIADIYDCWTITHQAARGVAAHGDPSVVNLLLARRAEVLVGDQIALSCSTSNVRIDSNRGGKHLRVKNFVWSSYHPIETFTHAVATKGESKVAYLSFPISQPREMEREGNVNGMEAVSEFVRKAFDIQSRNPELVVQCPLMIDELPFADMAMAKNQEHRVIQKIEDEKLQFDRSRRWPLQKLYGDAKPLASPPTEVATMALMEALEVCPLINEDVTFRDYRLVEQADFTVVFNPILKPGRKDMAKSVYQEIMRTTRLERHTFLFQDPTIDKDDNVSKELRLGGSGVGQMHGEPSTDMIIRCESVEKLFKYLANGGDL